jgi:hypothetical protein
MPLPTFYDSERVGQLFIPNTARAVSEGRYAGIAPASGDSVRVVLVLVDVQVDFVHADGSLCVPGAVEDTRRTIEWIFRYIDRVTTIAASLDSHLPIQIFFPTWWGDRETPSRAVHPMPSTDVLAGSGFRFTADWSRNTSRNWRAAPEGTDDLAYHTLIGAPNAISRPRCTKPSLPFGSAQAQPVFLKAHS